jgi:hypothetical protein
MTGPWHSRAGEDEPGRTILGHLDAVKPSETAAEQALSGPVISAGMPAEAAKAMKRVGLSSRAGAGAGAIGWAETASGACPPAGRTAAGLAAGRADRCPRQSRGRDLVTQLVAEHRASGGMVIAAVHGDGFAGSRTLLDLSKLKANT